MVKKTTLKKLLLILMIMLPASGCFDSRDINDRDIVTAILLDKTDYGYTYYAEIPSISGVAQFGGETIMKRPVIVKGEGRTLSEARENVDRAMDKPIFLGAIQTMLVTDNMASYGIEEFLLRIRENNNYRETVHVVVTNSEPEKLLSDIPENAESVGFAIDATLNSLVDIGRLSHIRLMDILEIMSSPYRHFILQTMDIINDEATVTGFTVFSGGMKTGFIPIAEGNSIVFMQAAKPVFIYTVPYNETSATVKVRLPGKKIKPQYADGKISFDIELKFKAMLMYPEKNKSITKMDQEIIKNTLQAMLELEFKEMFKKSQEEYKYDCFELHEPFRISYPEEYKHMDWAGEYQKISANFSVSVELGASDVIDYNPKE